MEVIDGNPWRGVLGVDSGWGVALLGNSEVPKKIF